MSLLQLNIKEASEKLEKKEISSVELTKAYIETSKLCQTELNSYITETYEDALKQAEESDKRRSSTGALSKIDGIPVAVKDLFLTKGYKTTAASKFLSNFVAPYESTVTQNLKNSGYVMLGKTNLDEFAMGSTNLFSYYGPSYNAWKAEGSDENFVPGGSSGASAAIVAARGALAALGTDTGGSVRQPASFTGTVGIKPTYGTCSRYGTVAFASSLDQAGVLTRSVEDNALMLQGMAGYDEKDSSMIKFTTPNYSEDIGKDIKGMKIGIPKEYINDRLNSEINTQYRNCIAMLEKQGAEIVEISLPHTKHCLPIYYIVATGEASSNLARYDGIRYGVREESDNLEEIYKKSRNLGYGTEVKARIMIGTYYSSADHYEDYIQASKVRMLASQDFTNAFKEVDQIFTPSTASTSFSENAIPTDPIEIYYNDIFTVASNLAGIPAISIPSGLSSKGLPIGVQLIGKHFAEKELYKTAYVLEKELSLDLQSTFVKKHKLF